MPGVYDALRIEYGRCPPDCRLCEEACARKKAGGAAGLSRVKAIHGSLFNGAVTCVQCSSSRCVQVCPAGAIQKSRADGVVRIDESRCVGCGLCTLACRYAGVFYDPESHHAFKCDRCDGEPECVAACPAQLITHVRNAPALSYLQGEDLLSPGVGACSGCPAELALRFTLRVLGKNTVLFTAPGCACAWAHGFGTRAGTRLARVHCLLNNVASTMSGVSLYYRSTGRDVNVVSFVGDGATVDIGLQALSAAAERQDNIIYICYDNEGYMNTGVQRSGSTPFGAATTSTPVGTARRGKEQHSKYLPLIMLFHETAYVATANMAYPEDYARKLAKAKNVRDGLSYIHLFVACPTGWGVPEDQGVQVGRLAVETNYFPLWEAERGRVRLTYEVRNPKPLREYLKLAGRYAHLNEAEMAELEDVVSKRYARIKGLASPCP